jgi:hypothetical protein
MWEVFGSARISGELRITDFGVLVARMGPNCATGGTSVDERRWHGAGGISVRLDGIGGGESGCRLGMLLLKYWVDGIPCCRTCARCYQSRCLPLRHRRRRRSSLSRSRQREWFPRCRRQCRGTPLISPSLTTPSLLHRRPQERRMKNVLFLDDLSVSQRV